MTWTTPTTEQIRTLRLRDGPNFVVPQEFLSSLILHESGAIYFPIYALDGTPVGWNGRAPDQKIWSQTLTSEIAPRFTSWTPQLSRIVYASRSIFLVEGSYDALALAPVIPWVISTHTSRVQKEILEWCKMWKLHVYTSFDLDLPDPKTQKATGQDATQKITQELYEAGCKVTHVRLPSGSPPRMVLSAQGVPVPIPGIHLKDPAQAFAVMGPEFHSMILNKVTSACNTPGGLYVRSF